MGRKPTDINEQQSRKQIQYVYRKLDESPKFKGEYDDIVNKHFSACVVEEAHRNPSGDRVCYMLYKPIVRQNSITTKARFPLGEFVRDTRSENKNWLKFAGEKIRREQAGSAPTFLSVCANKFA